MSMPRGRSDSAVGDPSVGDLVCAGPTRDELIEMFNQDAFLDIFVLGTFPFAVNMLQIFGIFSVHILQPKLLVAALRRQDTQEGSSIEIHAVLFAFLP